jgi:hypothetical protein
MAFEGYKTLLEKKGQTAGLGLQLAEREFERKKYNDLIAAQQAEAQQRIAGAQALPQAIAAQEAAFMGQGPQQQPFQPDYNVAIRKALQDTAGNPYAAKLIADTSKLLNPQTGGGVSYKNAKRDDGSVGIFAINPTDPTNPVDTGLNALPKSTTGSMNEEDAMSFAQQIVGGKLDINTLPKRGSVRQQILSKVYQIDPNFNVINAEADAKHRKDAANLRGIALIRGLDPMFENLRQAGAQLDNTGIPVWNKIKNRAARATGDPDIVAFDNARDDFVAEAERILLGSGVLSDSKYNRALENLNSAQSPEQMEAAIDQIKKVIAAREEALIDRPYDTGQEPRQHGTPQPTGEIKFLGFE